uniref:C2 domain-containing protein n=1 Tax=Periophthalmus magnuspinnatus TaxID=409849 RepID=A0A3B4AFB8_9GOBI
MAIHLPLIWLIWCGLVTFREKVKIYNLRASDLPSDLLSPTDGYVKVFCGSAALGQTGVRNDDLNPWWKEEFTYFKAQENDVLRLEVFDDDILFDDLLGVCQRQLRVGSYKHDCYLKKGGTLHYEYTLSAPVQK